jgi:phage gp37-like protein
VLARLPELHGRYVRNVDPFRGSLQDSQAFLK